MVSARPAVRARASPILPLRACGVAATALMLAAQIAYPLAPGWRAALATVTVTALAAAALAFAADAWGSGRALLGAAMVISAALVVEAVGVRTGLPFGDYAYGTALRPAIAGVPVIVALAWFGMGAPAYELAARAVGGRLTRIALGAAALTAWDLFLDPQMLRESFWRWRAGGWYRDVPLSNFVGWLLLSAAIVAWLDWLAHDRTRSRPLLGLYALMAAMETVGFLVFFRDPTVGVIGGVAMGAPLLLAARPSRASSRWAGVPRG